jgi:hypothetical protein
LISVAPFPYLLMFTLAGALPEAMRGVYAETPIGFDEN